MPADIVIKGGRVVDGTGHSGYTADIEIVDGRITRIGRSNGDARRVIDADGLVVTPGFIDIHTHYDAQLYFEPTARRRHGTASRRSSPATAASPSRRRSPATCRGSSTCCRASRACRTTRSSKVWPFTGGSFASYLDGLDGRIGVNMALFAGHAPIRRAVMGAAASERAATAAEIATMVGMLRQAMRGRCGRILDIAARHPRRSRRQAGAAQSGRSRRVDRTVGSARRVRPSIIEFLPRSGSDGYSAADRALMLAMCTASAKPMNVESADPLPRQSRRVAHRARLVEDAQREGHRIHPMFMVNIKASTSPSNSTFVLDEMLTFRRVLTLPLPSASSRCAIPRRASSSIANSPTPRGGP